MIILKAVVVKSFFILFIFLNVFMFSQNNSKFILNESLRYKFMNIDSYLKAKYIQNKKIYVYVSCLNNENIINFSISKVLQNNSVLDYKYYKSEYFTYLFSKKDREFLNEYFNFNLIDKNTIPYTLSIESNKVSQADNDMDSELGELLYRKCDKEFYLSYIFLPFSEDYLKIEYNLQKDAPSLKGSVH